MTAAAITTPAITVLMSCYNAARWLDESINSVLNQTFKDFEFIIIDDGSHDETLKIIRQFAEYDARIVVIAKPNTGLADSLNVGIQMARGKWIARLDADDICEPTRLEKQIDLARLNTRLVFIGSGLTEIDQYGNSLKVYRYPSRHTSLLKHLRKVRKFPPHSSAFYRAETVRAVGGYRTRIRRAQDWDLWLRLSEAGELACLDEPLVRVRKHADQISHDESGRRQKIDSRVAITSYFLRQYGIADPVGSDDMKFNSFRTWIEKRLEDEGLFAFESFRLQLRTLLKDSTNSLASVLNMISVALRSPAFMWHLMQQRLVGENLSRRLAREWISQSCTSVPAETVSKQ